MFNTLISSGFKGELLNKIDSKNRTKEALQKAIIYDYYLTPLEGIYINENIAGLIKFLASHEKMIPDQKVRNEFLKKYQEEMSQPKGLNFQYQQKTARVWLSTIQQYVNNQLDDLKSFYLFADTDEMPHPLINDHNDNNNLIYDNTALSDAFNKISKSYEAKKIFSFDHPLITNILKPYINEINDYKVFYLFGNYSGDNSEKLKNLKCEHQYTLLENTSDFISTIVKEIS